MRLKSRIKRLENKFDRYKPVSPIIFLVVPLGATVEQKYQEYLDGGGDPNAEIRFFEHATRREDEELTNPVR